MPGHQNNFMPPESAANSEEYFAKNSAMIHSETSKVIAEQHIVGPAEYFKRIWLEMKGRNYGKTAAFKKDIEEYVKLTELEREKTNIELEKQLELHRDNRRHHTIRRNPHKNGGNLIMAKKKRRK